MPRPGTERSLIAPAIKPAKAPSTINVPAIGSTKQAKAHEQPKYPATQAPKPAPSDL